MAFALTTKSRTKTQGPMKPVPKRKTAPGQHSNDSRFGFGKPVFQPDIADPSMAAVIQTKLKVGKLNDKFEQEADRVSEQVMRMPESMAQPPPLRITPLTQSHTEEDESLIQTKAEFEDLLALSPDLESFIASLRGGGRPLSRLERAFFETRFGIDFSQVRIHTGTQATASAQALKARAYTVGRDVVFGTGEFRLDSAQGKTLLAHELVHVAQQNRASADVPPPDNRPPQAAFSHESAGMSQHEADSLSGAEEKPFNQLSVASEKAADSDKGLAPRTRIENEILAAVDETAPPENVAEAAVGKEAIPTALTTEKAPASPEEDPAYQAVVEELEIKAKKEKTPVKKPGRKQEETVLAANSASKKIIEKIDAYRGHFSELELVVQPIQRHELTAEKFMVTFRETIEDFAKKLPEKKENYDTFGTLIVLKRGKEIAKQEVANQAKTHSVPLRTKVEKNVSDDLNTQESKPYELKTDPEGSTPTIKHARTAAPKPKTDDAISLDDKSRALDDALLNHDVNGQTINIDESSLALSISGEKTFDQAGEAKRKAQDEIEKSRPSYRREEVGVINKSQSDIQSLVNTGLKGHHGKREAGFKKVLGVQEKHKKNIETGKQGFLHKIEEIYERTKANVKHELNELEKPKSIEETFNTLISDAEKSFSEDVRVKLEYIYTPGHFGLDYSDWIDDHRGAINEKAAELIRDGYNFPAAHSKALKFEQEKSAGVYFTIAKKTFIRTVLEQVKDKIAKKVVKALNTAKDLIRKGNVEVIEEFKKLTPKEQGETMAVFEAVTGEFETLEESVEDRQRAIIDDMARTYNQSVGKLKTTFDKIKKDVLTGWLARAWNKLKAVVNAIIDFATRIAELLGRLVHLVGDIISSPRYFFNNLVTGVGQSFSTFVDRIDEFLSTAFFDWLRGSSGIPIQIPKDWGPKGIFSLFTQLLKLSTETIWERMEIVYDKTIANAFRRGEVLLGKGLEIFSIIKNEGLGGLWGYIKESLGNILEETLGMIKETVLYAAIKKVIIEIGKMLVPGGGFIVIAEKVIRLLQFIVEARNKILDLIKSFVDSVEMAVKGNVPGIVKHITGALTKFITVALDFLVSFFGLANLKEKVERFIERMRKPIIRGIDWVLGKFKPLVMKGKELVERGKEKVTAAGKKVSGAITGWLRRLLGVKKAFRGEDGSNHRLYFAEQKGDMVLMINPAPADRFESWVAHIIVDTSSEAGKRRAQKKTQAIAKARKIDGLKAQPVAGNMDAEKQASGENQKVKTIRGLMDELSALTGPLFTGQPPDCATEGRGLRLDKKLWKGQYGTKMEAEYLTNIKMPVGTEPAVSHHRSFAVINQRRNQGGSYYVLGHLLSQKLGGTGRKWENLTPLTREANNAHERIVEARVKNAVNASNIVYYKVEAKYNRPAAKGPNRKIQDIMNEEVNVSERLVCEAALVTPANSSSSGHEKRTPLVDRGTVIENKISQRPADYDLTGIRRETVYLDSGDVDSIAGIEGVNRPLAQKIVDAHRDKRSQFGSMAALAEYQFSDDHTFTALQKTTIDSLSDLGYVRLYERKT